MAMNDKRERERERERELNAISDAPPKKGLRKSEKHFRVVDWSGELKAFILYCEGDLVQQAVKLTAEQTRLPKLRIHMCYGETAMVPAETLDSYAIPEGADVQFTVSIQENAFSPQGDISYNPISARLVGGYVFYDWGGTKSMLIQRSSGKQGYFECEIKSATRAPFPYSMGLQNICLYFKGDVHGHLDLRRACSWSPYLPYEPPHAEDRGHRPHPVCWGCSPHNPWIDESPIVRVGDRIGLLVDCSNAPTFTLVVNGTALQTYLMGDECLNKTIYPCITSNSGCDFEVTAEPEVPERLPNIYEPQLWEWGNPGVTRRPQDP